MDPDPLGVAEAARTFAATLVGMMTCVPAARFVMAKVGTRAARDAMSEVRCLFRDPVDNDRGPLEFHEDHDPAPRYVADGGGVCVYYDAARSALGMAWSTDRAADDLPEVHLVVYVPAREVPLVLRACEAPFAALFGEATAATAVAENDRVRSSTVQAVFVNRPDERNWSVYCDMRDAPISWHRAAFAIVRALNDVLRNDVGDGRLVVSDELARAVSLRGPGVGVDVRVGADLAVFFFEGTAGRPACVVTVYLDPASERAGVPVADLARALVRDPPVHARIRAMAALVACADVSRGAPIRLQGGGDGETPHERRWSRWLVYADCYAPALHEAAYELFARVVACVVANRWTVLPDAPGTPPRRKK